VFGKRDRLLRHFDRLDLLVGEIDALERYTGIPELVEVSGALVFSQSNVIERAPHIRRKQREQRYRPTGLLRYGSSADRPKSPTYRSQIFRQQGQEGIYRGPMYAFRAGPDHE